MSQTPRQRREDILPYLKRGQQAKIAEKLGCAPSTVSNILNGYTSQGSDLARNIIRLGQEYAQRNNPYKRR